MKSCLVTCSFILPVILPAAVFSQSAYSLTCIRQEIVASAPGTKSVLFNNDGSRLYAMNLEGMSIFSYDRKTRSLSGKFQFMATKGTGWDYAHKKSVGSFKEKPVEACLTNHDSTLWVSLHNGGGIVPVPVANLERTAVHNKIAEIKLHVLYAGKKEGNNDYNACSVPLIVTGKTPKVIASLNSGKHLLVSNWHSHTVSILTLHPDYPYSTSFRVIPVNAIPRGIAVDEKRGKSYIAIMGGSSIAVINNSNWESERYIKVASNPRHLVLSDDGRLFVSFNNGNRIGCIDPLSGKTLFAIRTHSQPRTIKLSKDSRFLFVTCYSGNCLDVFKVCKDHFELIRSLSCPGKPVGVDIAESGDQIEAWVCCYVTGKLHVFTFRRGA